MCHRYLKVDPLDLKKEYRFAVVKGFEQADPISCYFAEKCAARQQEWVRRLLFYTALMILMVLTSRVLQVDALFWISCFGLFALSFRLSIVAQTNFAVWAQLPDTLNLMSKFRDNSALNAYMQAVDIRRGGYWLYEYELSAIKSVLQTAESSGNSSSQLESEES